MTDLTSKHLSRRTILRAGLGALGVGAVAFLSACGGTSTATTASGGTGGGAASTSPAPSASGGTGGAASTSPAPSASGAAAGGTVAAQGTPVGVTSSKGPKNPNATKLQ